MSVYASMPVYHLEHAVCVSFLCHIVSRLKSMQKHVEAALSIQTRQGESSCVRTGKGHVPTCTTADAMACMSVVCTLVNMHVF